MLQELGFCAKLLHNTEQRSNPCLLSEPFLALPVNWRLQFTDAPVGAGFWFHAAEAFKNLVLNLAWQNWAWPRLKSMCDMVAMSPSLCRKHPDAPALKRKWINHFPMGVGSTHSLWSQGAQGSAEKIILRKCSILRIPTSCYLRWVRNIPGSSPAFSWVGEKNRQTV